jgi:O-antigen ligase
MGLITKLISFWLITQLFFYGPSGPSTFSFLDNTRIDRIVFVLIITWFIGLIITRRVQLPKITAIEWFMFFFLVVSSTSFIISGANNDISEGKNKWLNAIINISYYPFITFFIMKSFTYSRKRTGFLLGVLCLIGTYLMISSFLEHYQIVKFIWPKDIINPEKGTHFGRSRGPFLDAVAMGRVLTIGFACFVFMIVQSKGFSKWILTLFSILSVGAIYFTQTRGPWIGFGLLLLLLSFSKTTMRKLSITIVSLIIIIALFGTIKEFSLSRGTLFSDRQNTVVDREISYLTTIKMIVDHPIVGIGFGMFNKEWSHYYHESKTDDFGGFDGSHNTFLTMICELGFVGFSIYLLMFISLFRLCYRTYCELDESHSFEKNLCLITIGLALMYIASGTVSDLRWSLMVNNLVYMFFGFVASIARSLENQADEKLIEEEEPDEQFA